MEEHIIKLSHIEQNLDGLRRQLGQLKEENTFLKKRLEQLSHIKATLISKNALASSSIKKLIQQLQEENL